MLTNSNAVSGFKVFCTHFCVQLSHVKVCVGRVGEQSVENKISLPEMYLYYISTTLMYVLMCVYKGSSMSNLITKDMS